MIGGVPVHEPGTAVSVSPTTAVPVTAGGVVLDGVAVERASAPALSRAATVTAAASTALDGNVQRRARATRIGRFSSDMVDSSWLRLSPLTSTHAVPRANPYETTLGAVAALFNCAFPPCRRITAGRGGRHGRARRRLARVPGSRRRREVRMERVLGTPALFATAYGNVGSSIYYALGLTAVFALGLTPLVFVVAGIVFAATAATYAEGTVRFPEAGGSSSFARHGFNELVSFGAAWSQMLVYIVTIATSAFFVPHYLSIFWEPLRSNPWDIVGGAVVIVVLVSLNVVGVTEAAKLSIGLAVIDFGTQVLLVLLGFALVFSPEVLVDNVHWGTAPTWANLAVAIPVAMLAYTGVETVSNLAEEAREPERSVPNAYKLVAVAVFAIYFTLPLIALSALPVKMIDGELTTLLALPPEQGGFANDPILGVVDNLGLEGGALRALQLYVGVLAATILFIATNAGIIGASRITYSMATYRQMPEVFRRLHPRLKTPYIALVLFAGIAPIVILLPGDVKFVGTLYSLGATLSFTVAHAAMVRLRMRPDPRSAYRARPNLRVARRRLAALRDLRRDRDRALVPRDPRPEPAHPLGRARLDRARASSGTSPTAAGGCARR